MFVSYAQNLEDVMLHRALHEVEQGFYIDAGAWHPEQDSVTKAFYERGWHGINIEPSTHYFDLLEQARARDINLNVALAADTGSADFREFPETGLSTLDPEIADRHADAGFDSKRVRVSTTTLRDVVSQHIPPSQPVHFLKIDVEGYEAQLLQGNDWSLLRPWIIVIEATEPLRLTPSFETWEPILKSANYVLAYQDGLNRFYVADQQSRLLGRFSYPPNVFDGYITSREAKVRDETAALRVLLRNFRKEADNRKRDMQKQARKYKQVLNKMALVSSQFEEAVKQRRDLETTRERDIARQATLECRLQKSAQQLQALEQQASRERHEHMGSMLELLARTERSELQHAQDTASLSWKLTRPVRWVQDRLTRLRARRFHTSVGLDERSELFCDGSPDPLADHFLNQLLKANKKG